MDRRKFLTKTLSASAGGLAALGLNDLPSKAFAGLKSESNSWKTIFAQALEQKPWLLSYASASQDTFSGHASMQGKWPEALNGTLYRNGPAGHEVGDYRYHHWFDGDGMIQAFRVSGQKVTHDAKFVQTHKLKAEEKVGRALYSAFGSVPPNHLPAGSPDAVNSANISVLHHHGKLLALWEAGSAWEIDPQTLDTESLYSFSDATAGVPFSAHPRVEADGTLWNFGYLSSANFMVFWHIDAGGKLVKFGKIKVDPITMVHDFIVTANHIVVMVAPFHFQPASAESFLYAHEWDANAPTKVLVIDKNDFDQHYWLELPAQWVFHFGNGWEDAAGIIRFDGARYDDVSIMTMGFNNVMKGETDGVQTGTHHQYRIDTKKRRISESPMFAPDVGSEFMSIDPRVSCQKNQKLFFLSQNTVNRPDHKLFNEVSSFDYESGVLQKFSYPDGQIPEEHLFVPKPNSRPEKDGWVIGTALDWKKQRTMINLFNADHLDAGPVAIATLPYALPLSLHGKFVND